nr:hypothetical protein [Arsenophonus endosymbiont of Bemisia tabaci]
MGLTYKKLYVIRKPTKTLDKRFNKKITDSMKKKASILFLLMKVVFHTIPRGLTAIPRKVNGVLVSRTGELKQKQMLSALYWAQCCLLSDYLISILTAMFSMHGSPKFLSMRGIWWNICLPIRQILIQLNINGHKRNAKKERSDAKQIFCSHSISCNQN